MPASVESIQDAMRNPCVLNSARIASADQRPVSRSLASRPCVWRQFFLRFCESRGFDFAGKSRAADALRKDKIARSEVEGFQLASLLDSLQTSRSTPNFAKDHMSVIWLFK